MLYAFLFTFFFFAATHFHRAGREHFSFSHRRYKIFMLFFQRNWSPLFFISRSSSFSVIHVNVDIKIKSKERIVFVVVVVFAFLSLKVRVAMRFTAETRWYLKLKFHPAHMSGWTYVRTLTDDFLRTKISWMH